MPFLFQKSVQMLKKKLDQTEIIFRLERTAMKLSRLSKNKIQIEIPDTSSLLTALVTHHTMSIQLCT